MWTYKDIQKLSKLLGLNLSSKREVLVPNLELWHRTRRDGTKTMVERDHENNTENIDMNVVGNNFAILEVHVKPRSAKAVVKSRRSSIVGLGESDRGIVSPTLLRPLRTGPSTPGRSCIKQDGDQ